MRPRPPCQRCGQRFELNYDGPDDGLVPFHLRPPDGAAEEADGIGPRPCFGSYRMPRVETIEAVEA